MAGLKDLYLQLKYRNRRRYKRYQVNNEIMLALGASPQTADKAKILDLGIGGVAFLYSGSDQTLNELHSVTLCNRRADELESVSCKMVSNVNWAEIDRKNSHRVGLRFRWLNEEKKQRLDELIRHYEKVT